MRTDRERLLDILDAISRIERYTAAGRDDFDRDEMIQVWVIHHLQLIGEAARAIAEDMRRRFPNVEWSKVIGMRHILVHQYFGLKLDIVWATVERDLPILKRDIQQIVASIDDED